MARKNPFANLMNETLANSPAVRDYSVSGASRSIMSTIDELAERADRLLQGETIVELDPDVIDSSFVQDRIDDSGDEFQELVAAIRERGQDSPILVRPHPVHTARYMVVFGHRRLSAMRLLDRKVRAVVKTLDDRDHVIAQGQENSARANLSFIEKAMFAKKLVALNYDSDNATVLSALSTDRATLSKMLSVSIIAQDILDFIGSAKLPGRDRWYEMQQLLEVPKNLQRVRAEIAKADVNGLDSDGRFAFVFDAVKRKKKAGIVHQAKQSHWGASDRSVTADIRSDGKKYTLALKAKDAVEFGDYLASNLDALYAAFRKNQQNQ
ncbi:plasmid partitioning protein RepB [Rhizobium sp.]|jgi:ParB family transcriptional regulator, chromosome partitioning protein|uniref:plasmid partitioning protein RepB n=1 Tax=Rhizobium sp. TaxID=391 RepID=UPI000E976EC1|nr:plasmid partitioning protein RepB [Rhizobium sp.]